ncbi:FKBP-type peptidyl-prolyl cis-trans isomerase [Oleiharenicola sp. Vm1]|uniref:FKBP-type peptidyl-prolyl cis-trans isomerase n=1 Tax=Oleiharenicola sp. Vm1 TaxID=3398393 RepID=UPI0039F61B8D
MSPTARRFAFLFASIVFLSASPLFAQRERLPPEDLEVVENRWPNAKKTSTGLRYIVLKEGDQNSPMPQPGDRAAVLYKGMLLDGTVFDQSVDPAHAFRPRVGRDELIPAWDQALTRMHKGEKWLLIVPYELGYGTRGNPPKIPKRATLVFEMELLDFGKNLPLN